MGYFANRRKRKQAAKDAAQAEYARMRTEYIHREYVSDTGPTIYTSFAAADVEED